MERSKMVREEKQKKAQEEGLEREPGVLQTGENGESLFSPRFKSVAAMAGWDEESILMASLIVEDTPDRDKFHNNCKGKKRQDSNFRTPPSTNSTRKRRANRSPILVPVPILILEDDESTKEGREKRESEPQILAKDKEKTRERVIEEKSEDMKLEKSSSSVLPCLDKLREELSCAICLEICFEPSTTSCGHSFCKKCLRSAADKCGKKCPKCRQLISNGRSCTVNTVLWNTIQLLFPREVEARKASMVVPNNHEAKGRSQGKRTCGDVRSRGFRPSMVSSTDFYGNDRRGEMLIQDEDPGLPQILYREAPPRLITRDTTTTGRTRRRRGGVPSQDEDAALALRLQREEFIMEAFRGPNEQSVSSISLARANLRAMASRAINIQMRSRPPHSLI